MNLVFIGLLALASCTPTVEHQVTAPQLTPLFEQIRKVKVAPPPTSGKPCAPPMPIPQRMLIYINGADQYAAMDGLEFLQAYADTRSCLRDAH